MNKQNITIFVNPPNAKSKATEAITRYVGDNLTALNGRGIHITFKYVTAENINSLKQNGITSIPALVYGRERIIGYAAIVKYLTPAAKRTDGYGGSMSPEEMVYAEMHREMLANKDDNNDMQEERDDQIKSKLMSFQARRAEMLGVSPELKIPGGRASRPKKSAPITYNTDEDFISASRQDNIELTPSEPYFDNNDGQAWFENIKNEEADKQGRKKTGKPWRRPSAY